MDKPLQLDLLEADGHGALSPSRVPQFINCHGWLARQPMPGTFDEGDTSAADWGTDSHAYLSKALELGIDPAYLAPEDNPDEAEKAKCAGVAFDWAVDTQANNKPSVVHSELVVHPFPGDLDPHTVGSADIVIATSEWLIVADLKTGYTLVEPTSEQLLDYLLGALNEYWPDRSMPCPFKYFLTVVIQPRAQHKAGPIRTMRWELEDVLAFEERLLAAVHANLRSAQPATPGDHCKYCRAKMTGSCAEYLSWAAQAGIPKSLGPVTEKSVQDMLSGGTLKDMSVEDLAQMKDMVPTLQALAEAVDKEVKTRLTAGTVVPGWKLGKVDGRPKWLSKDTDLRKQLKQLGLKPSQYEKKSLCTPLQTMKAKGITAEQSEGLTKLWSRGDPIYKVVEDTHPAGDSTAWMRTIPNFNREENKT